METRQQWGTRAGFILAAVGSAVGLGNIWRFPYTAYENGGGAFYLPYLFALLTTGISLLAFEFALGHRHRGSAPLTFFRIDRRAEFIGWWQMGITFIISTYYAVIIAWSMSYTYFSITGAWGEDTESFLLKEYLQVADKPGQFGGLVPEVLLPLALVWIIVLGVAFKGVKKGIEMVNRIFIPLLVLMFLIIVIRAITLDGALQGLDAFFKPDWSRIFDGKVWLAAYGQIFFSLSLAFGIMITYSSYLPKNSDTTNNAFITGFANSGFELLAGIGVFAALGFMANNMGVPVNEVATAGVGLAFIVFPQIINELPFSSFFGVLFFLSLTVAGITSLISLAEVCFAAVSEKFNVSRNKGIAIMGTLLVLVSLVFATRGGLMFLDVVDYFANNFGLIVIALVEIVVVGLMLRKLKVYQEHANFASDIKLGTFWKVSLLVVTPLVLGYMLIDGFIQNIKENYGGYPTEFVVTYGWILVAVSFVIAIIISLKKWDKRIEEESAKLEKEWKERGVS
ncbi:transporter [Bacillus manliponensis]|uniref:Transporter n=1 Tax=Bacillus manliponensis TaxID=574376 RepID=A0A073K3A2_9BACI|nr:sodium-dependent transporter [Bacillus manliponensis]KEK21061.1 transporter [Bacillus manliponensis]